MKQKCKRQIYSMTDTSFLLPVPVKKKKISLFSFALSMTLQRLRSIQPCLKRSFCSSTGLKAKENPYTKTLLLPKTSFPLRANAATREHLFRDRCTKDLYPWQVN